MRHYLILAIRSFKNINFSLLINQIGLVLLVGVFLHFAIDLVSQYRFLEEVNQESGFWVLLIMLFLIVSIVYINCYTLILIQKYNELLIRKSLGARGSDVFRQFFVDSIIRYFSIIMISIVVLDILINPLFNYFTSSNSDLKRDFDFRVVILLAVINLYFGALGGIVMKLNFKRIKSIRKNNRYSVLNP